MIALLFCLSKLLEKACFLKDKSHNKSKSDQISQPFFKMFWHPSFDSSFTMLQCYNCKHIYYMCKQGTHCSRKLEPVPCLLRLQHDPQSGICYSIHYWCCHVTPNQVLINMNLSFCGLESQTLVWVTYLLLCRCCFCVCFFLLHFTHLWLFPNYTHLWLNQNPTHEYV